MIAIMAIVVAASLWARTLRPTSSILRRQQNCALVDATVNNDLARVESLLARGADANAGCYVDEKRNLSVFDAVVRLIKRSRSSSGPLEKALVIAIDVPERPEESDQRVANAAVVHALLAGGADPNTRTPEGESLLVPAVSYPHNQRQVVDELLAYGANVNLMGNDESPLMAACAADDLRFTRRLLSSCANVNALTDQGTPLLKAVDTGDLAIVKLLVSHGADILLKDSHGKSAIGESEKPTNLEVGTFHNGHVVAYLKRLYSRERVHRNTTKERDPTRAVAAGSH